MTTRRRGLLLGLVWGVLVPPGIAGPATVLSADIAPRPVAEALAAFGRQTGLQVIYVSTVAEMQYSKGARAGLAAPAALAQLLDGTGLTFEFLNARTVRIFPASTIVPTLTASSYGPPYAVVGQASSRALGLEEVVVSGARGQEPVSRVPVDMVVWTEKAMEVSGIRGLAQIGALTPGMDFAFSPIGGDVYTHLDIRGVTNRGGATVGVYLDDVPIPPTRAAMYFLSFPMTFDLNRVEILRGPQTVLLGDHAQSGAIRFLANQPGLTDTVGQLRTEWGTTEYGGTSYEAGAAVGGPIVTDKVAFRVSGWFRQDGGYVDRTDAAGDILEANANGHTTESVRAALTFAPTPQVQLTPSLYYQSIRVSGQSTIDPTLSDPARGIFKGPSYLPAPAEDTYYLASLKVAARLGALDLSAFASYFDQWGTVALNGFSTPGLNDNFGVEQRVYSGEVRLSSPDQDASLGWVGGLFASHEHTHNPVWPVEGLYDDMVVDRDQVAAFGQLALRVTSRLTATAGVRIGHSEHRDASIAPPAFNDAASDTWSAPRFGLSWQLDGNNLIYLTAAKGYGSGGVYPLNPVAFPPDTLWSYEVGSKHDLLDHRLRVQAGLFDIRWNNSLATPDIDKLTSQEHDDIPGAAVSNGFDLAIQALLTRHTRAAVEVAYANAHVTQNVTVNNMLLVRSGVHLPISPWNATASLEQEFPLRGNVTASLRLEDAFRGSPGITYLNDPTAPPSPWYIVSHPDPSVNILNIRGAVTWPSFEVAASLRNALNSHPLLAGLANGVDNTDPTLVFTLVPRTLSVSAAWRF